MVWLLILAKYSKERKCQDRVTIQNLEIVKVDADQNIILVKGAVPGPKKSLVMLKESVKA